MSILRFAASGQDDGTPLTLDNSPGDDLNYVGADIVYATAGPTGDLQSCLFGSAGSGVSGWNINSGTVKLVWEFYRADAVTVDMFLALIGEAAGSVPGVRAQANIASRLRVGVSGTTNSWQDTTQTIHGAWRRFELLANVGNGTAGTGSFRAGMWATKDGVGAPLVDSTLLTNRNTSDALTAFVRALFYTSNAFYTRHWQAFTGTDAVWGASPYPGEISGSPIVGSPGIPVDARGLTSTTGPLTLSINPSTGVIGPVGGVFVIPQSPAASTRTLIATDGATTKEYTVNVPALSTSDEGLETYVKVGGVLV